MKCNQCGKQAIINYEFGPLCVDCQHKFLQSQDIVIRNSEGAEKIKKFTEAILKEKKLDKKQKDEIIQQLDLLTQQLSLKKELRNTGVIKSIFSSITSIINFSASLLTLWDPIKDLFS